MTRETPPKWLGVVTVLLISVIAMGTFILFLGLPETKVRLSFEAKLGFFFHGLFTLGFVFVGLYWRPRLKDTLLALGASAVVPALFGLGGAAMSNQATGSWTGPLLIVGWVVLVIGLGRHFKMNSEVVVGPGDLSLVSSGGTGGALGPDDDYDYSEGGGGGSLLDIAVDVAEEIHDHYDDD